MSGRRAAARRSTALALLMATGAVWSLVTAVPSVAGGVDPTTLTASPRAQSAWGSSVTLKARISPPNTSGSVRFYDGSAVIAWGHYDAAATSTPISVSTPWLAPGQHLLRVVFTPEGHPAATSASRTISYRVTRTATVSPRRAHVATIGSARIAADVPQPAASSSGAPGSKPPTQVQGEKFHKPPAGTGSLPFTGAEIALLALLAALLVLVGAGVVRAARRRYAEQAG